MFIVKIGVLSLVAVCLSYCSGRTNAAGEKLSCRSMQVEGGYGYVVVYIIQNRKLVGFSIDCSRYADEATL